MIKNVFISNSANELLMSFMNMEDEILDETLCSDRFLRNVITYTFCPIYMPLSII